MSLKKHSKESIIQTLQNLARSLKKTNLSRAEINTVVPSSSVCAYFGSIGNALVAAGLERTDQVEHLRNVRITLPNDDLFLSLQEVENAVGREPAYGEYQVHGKYSLAPFKRFGKWPDVIAQYRKWKSERGAMRSEDGRETRESAVIPKGATTENGGSLTETTGITGRRPPLQLFGAPIEFRGLRHAPLNEQGVVYLFGMVSRELGFNIEALQQGFPDCEGKYLYDKRKNLWAKARIEFEFKASNFREHGHDQELCDFIVCWENDWPDCPMNVVELRKEILKLSST